MAEKKKASIKAKTKQDIKICNDNPDHYEDFEAIIDKLSTPKALPKPTQK